MGRGFCAAILSGQEPGHPGALGEGRSQPCPACCLGLTGRERRGEGRGGEERGGEAWDRPTRGAGKQGRRQSPGWEEERSGRVRSHTSWLAFFRRTGWAFFPGELDLIPLFTLLLQRPVDHLSEAKNSARATPAAAEPLALPCKLPPFVPVPTVTSLGSRAPHCCKARILPRRGTGAPASHCPQAVPAQRPWVTRHPGEEEQSQQAPGTVRWNGRQRPGEATGDRGTQRPFRDPQAHADSGPHQADTWDSGPGAPEQS